MIETKDGGWVQNQEIESAGLQYTGHFRQFSFVVNFSDCAITIPESRREEFLQLVLGVNDGSVMVAEALKGKLVQVWADSHWKVTAIAHITNGKFYIINKEEK